MARENLKKARRDHGWTQQALADRLDVDIRYYKAIESGERLGAIWLWDALEDLFNVHQRTLREKALQGWAPPQEDSPS